jgi:hypothetical protein
MSPLLLFHVFYEGVGLDKLQKVELLFKVAAPAHHSLLA